MYGCNAMNNPDSMLKQSTHSKSSPIRLIQFELVKNLLRFNSHPTRIVLGLTDDCVRVGLINWLVCNSLILMRTKDYVSVNIFKVTRALCRDPTEFGWGLPTQIHPADKSDVPCLTVGLGSDCGDSVHSSCIPYVVLIVNNYCAVNNNFTGSK